MPFALLLSLVAIASGSSVTYLYDKNATLAMRLCAGACTGFAMLGLIGFMIASLIGLTPLTLVLTAALVATPLVLMWQRREWRALVREDVGELSHYVRRAFFGRSDGEMKLALLVFYGFVALLFWFLFGRAMFVSAGEIYTGVDNNLGDLPFHISIISGFAYGNNFPPEHTEFAGIRLTYPFLVDFVTAMFVRAGASLDGALFWQNFVLALSLVGLLHRYALKLTKDRLAALVTPAIVLLSGGFGWYLLWQESQQPGSPGLFGLLEHLPHDYTITSNGLYRWGNALTTLLIPQRGLLFGLPFAIIVITLWWEATGEEEKRNERREDAETRGPSAGKKKKKQRRWEAQQLSARREELLRRPAEQEVATAPVNFNSIFPFTFLRLTFSQSLMLTAGVVAGSLPLVHAHSFVVLMAMGACLALLFPKWWQAWFVFFVVASMIAAPQMWWATRGSAVRAGSFFGWSLGWEHGEQNVFWFWLKNTGLFIPLLIAALVWRGRDRSANSVPLVPMRLLLFYLPFTLCFIIPNLFKLSPWGWDNIKIIFYWWVASAPLIALLLAHWWRKRAVWWRVAATVTFAMLILAGSLDVWRVVSKASQQRIFDREGIELAELIKRETPARSLILHAPTYNHPVFLTGRRSVMGYGGHLWSQGLDYAPREADVRKMFAGSAGAPELLERYGVEYVVLSPLEQTAMPINQMFFERYTKIGEAGAYRLYKTTRR